MSDNVVNSNSGLQRVLLGALVILFVVSPGLWGRLTPNDYDGGTSRDAGAAMLRNASSVGMMLGELRTSFSDILVMKTERYLHSGVQYAAHTDEGDKSLESDIENLDAHQEDVGVSRKVEAGGHQAKTLIRSEDHDFRGIVGHLEREVKPYSDSGAHADHTDGRQILPWFRVATLSDGQHVRAYTSGAYWLGGKFQSRRGNGVSPGRG